jgi:hypothetical protein
VLTRVAENLEPQAEEPGRAALPDVPASSAPLLLARTPSAMLALQRSVGNAAAQQVLAREPAKPAADADAKGWEDLPFGSTIYKELIKEYTPEKLLKLALPHLKSLPEKMPEVAVEGAGLEGKETKQLAGGAASFAHKAAEEWMKTPEGKAWLDKAAGWAKQHPKTVYFTLLGAMAAAIAGAAVAYFTGNLDPPLLEKKFKALGFEITPGVDIGKFTETILQSAKLSISRELGQGVAASISGDVADGGKAGWSGSAGAKLGTKDVFGTYKLKWDEKGDLGHGVGFGAYGLTGSYGWGKGDDTGKLEYKLDDRLTTAYSFQGGDKGFHSAELKLKPLIIPIETTAMVKFNADGSAILDASSLYKSATLGSYKLGIKGPLAGGKPDEAMVFTFGQSNKDAAGSTGSAEWTFNPLKPGGPVGKYDFSAGVYPGLTLAQKLTVGEGQVLSHETKLTGEALKGQIKADLAVGQNEAGAVTAGGGLTIKTEDAEWAVRAAFHRRPAQRARVQDGPRRQGGRRQVPRRRLAAAQGRHRQGVAEGRPHRQGRQVRHQVGGQRLRHRGRPEGQRGLRRRRRRLHVPAAQGLHRRRRLQRELRVQERRLRRARRPRRPRVVTRPAQGLRDGPGRRRRPADLGPRRGRAVLATRGPRPLRFPPVCRVFSVDGPCLCDPDPAASRSLHRRLPRGRVPPRDLCRQRGDDLQLRHARQCARRRPRDPGVFLRAPRNWEHVRETRGRQGRTAGDLDGQPASGAHRAV